MLRTDYTENDRKKFQELRYTYPDTRIMRRFEILWLHACGKFAPEIAGIVKQNRQTVRDVIKMFQNGGIELVTTIDSNHPKSELEDHRVSIIEEFTKRPPGICHAGDELPLVACNPLTMFAGGVCMSTIKQF